MTDFNTPALYGFAFLLSIALAFGIGITVIALVFPWGFRG